MPLRGGSVVGVATASSRDGSTLCPRRLPPWAGSEERVCIPPCPRRYAQVDTLYGTGAGRPGGGFKYYAHQEESEGLQLSEFEVYTEQLSEHVQKAAVTFGVHA